MNGLDILAIVALLLIIWEGALRLDRHEAWLNRRQLKHDCWRKIAELNGEVIDGECDEG